MTTEEKYIYACYGLPADMPKWTVRKNGQTLTCHTSSEVCAMIEDGWKVISSKGSGLRDNTPTP